MGTGLIVPRSNKRYGWVPQRGDIRDQRFTLRLESLPSKADTRPQDVADTILNQGNLGSCHDDETEILTEFGFKLFSQLNGSERLATVNPDTAELSFEVPVRLVRFHYTGPLYCVDNQSLNFRVTPDHQMLVRKWNGRDRTLDSTYSLVPMKDVGWYTGLLNRVIWRGEVAADTYTLPGVDHKHKPQRESRDVPMRAWMRFLGLYLAEGTMLKRDQQPGRVSYKIQIAATKEREKEFARAIFADLDITALELNDRFTFSNKQIYAAMESLGLLGIKAGQKFVPAFVFRQGAEMITEFLAGHFAGDGTEQYGIRAHYTSSVQLASDLQALIFLSGNETRMSVRAGRTSMTADGRAIAGSLPGHRISVCERKNLSLERKNTVFTEEYDGEVFCAEVPTFHTLVTRRQGKVLVSGNCTANSIAGMYRYEAHKQGLPDIHPARLQIYYDERALEGTVDSDAGAMLRDGLKVVATNGVAPEELWPYDISKFTQKPPQDVYDAALKHQALKYQAIDQDLNAMKSCLAAGFQFVFGFTVYSSFESAQVAKTGQMPLPGTNESVLGGHAVRCFTGDTKVSLLDGRELSFEALVREYGEPSMGFWVYSCDKDGNVVPGYAHSVRKTGQLQRTVCVVLDNEEVVCCTPEHKFLLRDGSYRMAKDLKGGDSLMPLYRKDSTDKGMSGYEKVYNLRTNAWRYTHRIVAAMNGRYPKGRVVHHIDFNKRNNDPQNLSVMSWQDHTALHNQQARLLTQYACSEQGRQKSRELMTTLWRDEEWRSRALVRIAQNGKSVSRRLAQEGRCGFQNWSQEQRIEAARKVAEQNRGRKNSPEHIAKVVATKKQKAQTDPEYKRRQDERAKRNLMNYQKAVSAGEVSMTDKQLAARKRNGAAVTSRLTPEQRQLRGAKTAWTRFYKDKFPLFEDYLASRSNQADVVNHRVVSVHDGPYADVYDMTVDKHHNFALSSGVFVHNCVGYDDTLFGGVGIIANSWGDGWGDHGYFYMPYAYLTNPNLASDFWTIQVAE